MNSIPVSPVSLRQPTKERMTTSYCYTHHQEEDVFENPYRICGECFHVYNTPESLIIAYNEDITEEMIDACGNTPPIKTLEEVETIFFCPVCIHDF